MTHRRYGPLQSPLITSAIPLRSSLVDDMLRKNLCSKYGPSRGSLVSEAAMEEFIKNVGNFLEGKRTNGNPDNNTTTA